MKIKKQNIVTPTPEESKSGWEEAFQEMAKNGDDELLIPDVFEDEDLGEWNWKEA